MKAAVLLFATLASAAAMSMPQIVTEGDGALHAYVLQKSGDVCVRYTLAGEPAVVTATIRLNGEVVPASTFEEPTGELNCLVQPGSRRGWLKARGDWAGRTAAPEALSVELRAWSTNTPPDCMSVDLGSGDLRYYASTNDLPYGVDSDVWRASKCLLRLVPAAGETFRMGSPTNETGRTPVREVAHNVTLTKDFYLGVFEVTIGQYTNVVASWPKDATRKGFDFPINQVVYDDIHGEGGFLTVLGSRSGVSFGLPTDAQWEFACRAGSRASYCNGTDAAAGLDAVGWYKDSSGYPSGSAATQRVGMKEPNAFGIYDMHGNIYELCRDWYAEGVSYSNGSCVTDPTGTSTGSTRVARGGSNGATAAQCRSAFRMGLSPSSGNAHVGFRISCPAVAK